MPISEGASAAIVGGINAVGRYFATKGIASEQKKTEAARRRVIELQAEEQRIRNDAARMSLAASNALLPFAVSNPGLSSDAYAGNVKPSGMAPAAPGSQAAGPGGLVLIGAIVILGALMFIKPRRV